MQETGTHRHPCRAGEVRIVVDEQVTLREMVESDASEIYQAIDSNRDHLRKWLQWVDPTTEVEDCRKFFASTREKRKLGTGLQLGIERNGRLIGQISFNFIDRTDRTDRHAMIGYWLIADEQGKGVMTRACGNLIDYGFDCLALDRVVLRAARANARSRGIPERLGFQRVGVTKEPGMPDDPDHELIVYALSAADWKSRRA